MQSHRNQEDDHSNQTQFDTNLNHLPTNHWQQNDDNNWIRSLLTNSRMENSNNIASNNPLINSSVPPSLPPLPPVQTSTPSLLQSRYYPSTSSSSPGTTAATACNSHLYQSYPTLSRSNCNYSNSSGLYSRYNRWPYNVGAGKPLGRPRLTTTLWEDESTLCYQVDCQGICVARRQDNNMINGTKLLNVAGMSRGKRDGILKNERGRVVVKVGAMHLKGVWIPFVRARALANQFKILDVLYPIFSDDPISFLYPSHLYQMNRFNNSSSYISYKNTSTKSTYRGFYSTTGISVAGTTGLKLLANSNRMQSDSTSVDTTNETYDIYHSHSTQQPRASHHLYYDQQQQDQLNHQTTTATDTTTTDIIKNTSFDSTDFSTANASTCSNLSVLQRVNNPNSRESKVNLTRPIAHPYYYNSDSNNENAASTVETTTKTPFFFNSLARRASSSSQDNSTGTLYQQPTATVSSSSTSSSSLSSLHPDNSKSFW